MSLAWRRPLDGDPVQTYVIEAGSAPGAADLASFSTGSTATTFEAAGVPAGTYYLRVRANNGGGSGPLNHGHAPQAMHLQPLR